MLPELAEAFRLHQAGRLDEAEAACAKVLAKEPGDAVALINAGALSNLGFALIRGGRFADALTMLDRAIAQKPDYAQAHNNRGIALSRLARHRDALAAFARAVKLDPKYADAAVNLGDAQARAGDAEAALESYAAATRIDAGNVAARTGHAFATALRGDLTGARAALESVVAAHPDNAAAWQTLGAVANWAWDHDGAEAAFRRASALRPDDGDARFGVSMLSLPHLLGTRVDVLPGTIPYLAAPQERRAAWAERVARPAKPRVGLAWSVHARDDHGFVTLHKSIPPAMLDPVLATPGVSFVSLQPGAAGDPTAFGAHRSRIADIRADLRDFGDTAAPIASLDLVVTADTAVAHVAGALGIPVWMLDRLNGCWRWRLAPDTSPWYPTLTIFRQSRFGEWEAPVERLRTRLHDWAASPR